jgi:hypothetical protein
MIGTESVRCANLCQRALLESNIDPRIEVRVGADARRVARVC